jgi:hypothetical protein
MGRSLGKSPLTTPRYIYPLTQDFQADYLGLEDLIIKGKYSFLNGKMVNKQI